MGVEQHERPNGERWLQRFQRGSPLVSTVLLAVTLSTLLSMIWLLPEPTLFQRQLARAVLSICLASLAIFVMGGVILRGTVSGFTISAGGGMAILVIFMWLYDPFPTPTLNVGSPEWKGGVVLGELISQLSEAYAQGETSERIEIDPAHSDEVIKFSPGPADWAGNTWTSLVQRICDVNPCLKCTPTDPKTLRLSILGPVQKHCSDPACQNYWYTCKSTP